MLRQLSKVIKYLEHRTRNFTDRSEETIMSLYKNLVRPHSEFCTPVWSPHLVKDSKLIEGVQCRATKLVQGIEHWKYENRLTYLRLPELTSIGYEKS